MGYLRPKIVKKTAITKWADSAPEDIDSSHSGIIIRIIFAHLRTAVHTHRHIQTLY